LTGVGKTDISDEEWNTKIEHIMAECARLDGFNVTLKISPPQAQSEQLSESKNWNAPVRVWIERDDWENEEDNIKGGHDRASNLRPEYIVAMTDTETGSIDPEALDIDCIEANDYNLSAGRYKPFEFKPEDYNNKPSDMIQKISQLEKDILIGLESLSSMLDEYK
jgi:type I restriction enzyme M protein